MHMMKSEKKETTEQITEQTKKTIRTEEEKENYKYLDIFKAFCHETSKDEKNIRKSVSDETESFCSRNRI